MTLDDAIRTALERAPAVRGSGHAARAATEHRGVAFAGYLPALDAEASYTRQTWNFVPRPGDVPQGLGRPSSSNESFNFFRFMVTLRQTIYDFGRTGGAVDSAKADERAARLGIDAVRLEAWETAVNAYYGVLAAEDMLAVASEQRELAARHAARARELLAAGARPRIDVVRTEAELRLSEAGVIAARETVTVARSALLRAMGTGGSPDFSVVRPAAGTPLALDVERALAQAREARPERKVQLQRVESRQASVRAAWGGHFPILSAQGSFVSAGTEIQNLVWNWAVGVTLTVPIFSGLATFHSIREQEAVLAVERAALDDLDLAIEEEVRQAASRVIEARARIPELDAAVAASREAVVLAEGRYEAGAGSQIELLDARTALAAAESRQVQARYELAVAEAAWQRAIGTLPER